jgi:transcriptional regulator with XRE-family HTH domain
MYAFAYAEVFMRYRLIALMHEHKMTLADLATRLHLSNAQLCLKLCGERTFTLSEIETMLRMFPAMTFAELFPKEEEVHAESPHR